MLQSFASPHFYAITFSNLIGGHPNAEPDFDFNSYLKLNRWRKKLKAETFELKELKEELKKVVKKQATIQPLELKPIIHVNMDKQINEIELKIKLLENKIKRIISAEVDLQDEEDFIFMIL